MRRPLPQSAHNNSHKGPIRGHRDATRLTKKGRAYFYRRRLPAGVPGEIMVSLSTSSFRRAEWLAGCLERRFQRIPWTTMTRDEIQALLRGLLEQLTDDDEIARLEFKERGKPIYGHWSDMEDHDGEVRPVEASAIQRDIQFWRDILDEGDFSAVDETVDELLQGREVDPETRRRLAVGVIETFIKGKEVSLGRTMGNGFTVLEVPPGPLVPTPPVVPRTAVEGAPVTPAKPLASTLVAPFAQHRLSRGVAQRDVNKEQTHLRRFFEVNGDRAVDQYGRGDVTKWLDTLRRLPKHNGRSAIQRAAQPSLNELIEQADAADAPRLGEKTVENNLATLRAFLDFAVDAELMTRTQRRDVVDGHKFRDAHADNEQRDQWRPDELTRLFSSPVWAGYAGGNRWASPGDHIPRNSAQFWLPLLALYHGARLEEFSDLYRRDVVRIDGTWAFSIAPSVIEEVAEDGTKKVDTSDNPMRG